jgi:hypothetical protein
MFRRVSALARHLLVVAVMGALAVPTLAVAGDDGVPGRQLGRQRQGAGQGQRLAKGDGRKERGERAGRLSPEERAALRDRVQQKIQTYLTVELSSRAGLDEKKALQLGAAIKAQQERRQATREKKHAELQKLRDLVQQKAADAALKAQVKAVVDQSDREEQLQALLDDTAKFLTPLEQAKIVVAWPDVMKDARRLIAQARREHRGGGQGAGDGTGDGDDQE